MKRIRNLMLISLSALVVTIVLANLWVVLSTHDQVVEEISQLDRYQLGVVLGTSRLTLEGEKNPFFEARMNAASLLYKQGLVADILVSGDNESRYYNEPRDMTEALITRGIPREKIQKDPAGLRTLDSIIRLRTIHGVDSVLIVTQKFHAYRALFIANHIGLTAQVYTAASPFDKGPWVYIRELVARPLAVIDIYILGRQPKYSTALD